MFLMQKIRKETINLLDQHEKRKPTIKLESLNFMSGLNSDNYKIFARD